MADSENAPESTIVRGATSLVSHMLKQTSPSPSPTASPSAKFPPTQIPSPMASPRAVISPIPSPRDKPAVTSLLANRSSTTMLTAKPPSQRPGRPLSAPRSNSSSRNAAGAAAAAAGDLELARVKDTLKCKEAELEKAQKEVQTLKSSLSIKSRALEQKTTECELLREKAVSVEGSFATTNKEASMAKTDKKKLESQVADLLRQNAKLQEKLTTLQAKSPSVAAQFAALQSEVRSVKKENEQLVEHAKALDNIMRNKDREIAKMTQQVADANAILMVNKELENNVLHTAKQLEDTRNEVKTLQLVNRQKEQEIAKLHKDLETGNKNLNQAMESLSLTIGDLKANENRCHDLETEVAILRDELARASAVATRVATHEYRAGAKDDGIVLATVHFEEVKYLNGEIARLKEKIALLERDLQVSHELKEKFKRQSKGRASIASSDIDVLDAVSGMDSHTGSVVAGSVGSSRRLTANLELEQSVLV